MEQFGKDVYKIFSDQLSQEEFEKLWNSLRLEGQKTFGRASFMYERGSRCRSCDSDVCISLLCSAVEAVSGGSHVIFKDWLLRNKLSELADKDERGIRKSLNQAYNQYLQDEKEREGIAYNFRRFLVTFCPDELKNPPIKVYKGKGEPFEIAVRGLYQRFRSVFLHKGIGYASIADRSYVDKETGVAIQMIATPFMALVDNKIVSFELTRLTEWFASVVKQSLCHYLLKHTVE